MKRSAVLATVAGLLIFTGVLVWQGAGEVTRALGTAGWALLFLVPVHLIAVVANAVGWWILFPPPRPRLRTVVRLRWLGESVNQLLPVAQVGGEVVKARLMRKAGASGGVAGGTVVVGLTLAGVTQAVFGLLGVTLLVARLGHHRLVPVLLAGLGGFLLLLGLFYRQQRRGLFGGLARRMARWLGEGGRSEWAANAKVLDQVIREVHARRRAVSSSLVCYFLGWVLGTGEVWVAMRLLGAPVGVVDALMLESVGQAVRGTAFLVPGALGVQEGAYLALGTFMGFGPGVSLALSLSKRTRELLLGVPGLVTWQLSEGVGLWRRTRESGYSGQEGLARQIFRTRFRFFHDLRR